MERVYRETGEIHYDEVKEIKRIETFAEIIVKPGEKLIWFCSDNFFRLGNGVEGTRIGKIHTLKNLKKVIVPDYELDSEGKNL